MSVSVAGFVEAAVGEDGTIFEVLLHFDDLPGKERWHAIASKASDSFDLLKRAVAITLWHQTQEATDCRWMKVLAALLSRSLMLPSEQLLREILEYPNFNDQRKVRPLIRSTEGGVLGMTPPSSHWPERFWRQAFELTREDHVRYSAAVPANVAILTVDQSRRVREALRLHSEATTNDTDIDARHEAVFGFAHYALTLLNEALSLQNASSVSGRLILRSQLIVAPPCEPGQRHVSQRRAAVLVGLTLIADEPAEPPKPV